MSGNGRDRQEPAQDTTVDRYGEELLSANWNPVIELLAWSCARTSEIARRTDTSELREEEADAFLGRIYTSGA